MIPARGRIASACLALWLVATQVGAQWGPEPFSFAPPTDTGLPANQSVSRGPGTDPLRVVSGFFNDDPFLDLATANLRDSVSILLGDGDGTFSRPSVPQIPLGSGLAPTAIVAGDWNGDTRTDFAVLDRHVVTVTVLLGDGSGGFSQRPEIPVSTIPTTAHALVTADFNLDARPDLALITRLGIAASRIHILLRNGAGGFSASQGSPIAAPGAFSLVAGRLSGADTRPDIVYTRKDPTTEENAVVLLEGLGNGSLSFGGATPVSRSTLTRPFDLATNDLTGDGFLDLVVVNRVGRQSAAQTPSPFEDVEVLRGTGTSGFVSIGHFPANADPIRVTTTDFDGDGRVDVAVANSAFTFSGSVLLGSNGGTLGSPTLLGAGGNPFDEDTPDLNADGAPDLVIVNQPSHTLTVYLNGCPAVDFSIVKVDSVDPVTAGTDLT